jgi:hypothetical protein
MTAMDPVIFEDDIQYDAWVKPLLALPIIVLVVLAALFYIDGHYSNVFARHPARVSRVAFFVVLFSTALVLAVYWLLLPKKIKVCQEGINVQFGSFSWKIPYRTIEAVKAAKGLFTGSALSLTTSYKSQIEIVRKGRLKIRISPHSRDQFLEMANRALEASARNEQEGKGLRTYDGPRHSP